MKWARLKSFNMTRPVVASTRNCSGFMSRWRDPATSCKAWVGENRAGRGGGWKLYDRARLEGFENTSDVHTYKKLVVVNTDRFSSSPRGLLNLPGS